MLCMILYDGSPAGKLLVIKKFDWNPIFSLLKTISRLQVAVFWLWRIIAMKLRTAEDRQEDERDQLRLCRGSSLGVSFDASKRCLKVPNEQPFLPGLSTVLFGTKLKWWHSPDLYVFSRVLEIAWRWYGKYMVVVWHLCGRSVAVVPRCSIDL